MNPKTKYKRQATGEHLKLLISALAFATALTGWARIAQNNNTEQTEQVTSSVAQSSVSQSSTLREVTIAPNPITQTRSSR